MSEEQILKPGHVNVSKIVIDTPKGANVDVTPQCAGLTLVQNIVTPWMCGSMMLLDGQTISSLLPLVGNEYADIAFNTPGLDGVDHRFFIYAMSDKKPLKNNVMVYELLFISMEAINNTSSPVSKVFRGDPTLMVNDIVANHLGSEKYLLTEPASNTFSFIANFWKPAKCLKYIAAHALDENGKPTFVCYEDIGGYKFLSLNSLVNKDIKPENDFYTSLCRPAKGTDNTAKVNWREEYSNIISYEIHTGFNYFDRSENGFYGGRMISYDNITGNYKDVKVDALKDYNLMNPYEGISGYELVTSNANIKYTARSYNNIVNSKDNTTVDTALERKMYFERLRTHVLNIQVLGRTDYFIGKKVNVTLPKSGEPKKDESNIDTFISGNYIITGIKHVLSGTEMKTNLELCKDSLLEELK